MRASAIARRAAPLAVSRVCVVDHSLPRMYTRDFFAIVCVIATLVLAAPGITPGIARAAIPAVLIGPDLQPRPVNLQGIGDGTVSYFANDRVYRTESLNKLVMIRDIAPHGSAPGSKPAPAPGSTPGNPPGNKPAVGAQNPGGSSGSAPAPASAKPGAANAANPANVTGAAGSPASSAKPNDASPTNVAAPPAQASSLTPQASSAPGLLETVDGQRFPGRWSGASDDGQTLRWKHETLGDVTLALEKIRAITFAGATADEGDSRAPTSDRLSLANGDTMEGFVAGVSAKGVDVRPANAERSLVIPLERVKAIRLANATPIGAPAGHLVWLADSTRVMTSTLTLADDRFTIEPLARTAAKKDAPAGASAVPGALPGALPGAPPAGPITLAPHAVTRIDLSTAAGRLVPLASLVSAVTSGGDVLGLPTPPRVERDAAFLHAPVKMKFTLPQGATRFAAIAKLELDEADPQRSKRWADMEVIVSVDDREAKRVRINGRTPTADIGVPCEGATLSIELATGANGPVLDRLSLRDAAVLVRGKID